MIVLPSAGYDMKRILVSCLSASANKSRRDRFEIVGGRDCTLYNIYKHAVTVNNEPLSFHVALYWLSRFLVSELNEFMWTLTCNSRLILSVISRRKYAGHTIIHFHKLNLKNFSSDVINPSYRRASKKYLNVSFGTWWKYKRLLLNFSIRFSCVSEWTQSFCFAKYSDFWELAYQFSVYGFVNC